MASYFVLRVNNEHQLCTIELNEPTAKDSARVMLKKTDSGDLILTVPNDLNYGWKYDYSQQLLTDKQNNQVQVSSNQDVLRIVNLFKDYNAALKALFDPDESQIKHMNNLINSLLDESKKQIKRNHNRTLYNKRNKINTLSSEKQGALISAGIWYNRTLNLYSVLDEIQTIAETKQKINGQVKKKIEKVIAASDIANYRIFQDINDILNSKYDIPKKKAILNVIKKC